LLLQGLHAPWMLDRISARSGRDEMGMMWSPTVDRMVQPVSRSQQVGSSTQTCLLNRCHALVERMRWA